MNRDDIAHMWEKANGWNVESWPDTVDELKRFAALVIQHKALDQLTAAGQYEQGFEDGAAAEREECAKVCESVKPFGPQLAVQKATIEDCAAAIRARGQQ